MIQKTSNGTLTSFAEKKIRQNRRKIGTPDARDVVGLATDGHVAGGRSADEAQLVFGRGLCPGRLRGQEAENSGVSVDQGNAD